MNNYGKGKSFYFAGTLGQALIEWHFFEHFDIVEKTMTDNTHPLVTIIDGSEYKAVETAAPAILAAE